MVLEVSGASAMCEREGEEDREDMRSVPVADAAALVHERAGSRAGEYRPLPDVQLVRNMWMRRGARARVHAVKFMWGLSPIGKYS